MFVSEIMSRCVTECTEDMGLTEIYDLIRKCEHGLVVVIDSLAHRVPIGVVSERSICEQIIARGRNPRNLIAGSVLDSRIKTVSETDLVEALDTDNLNDVAAIIVTNDKRQVSGLMPRTSFASLRSAAAAARPALANKASSPRRTPVREIPVFGWIQ